MERLFQRWRYSHFWPNEANKSFIFTVTQKQRTQFLHSLHGASGRLHVGGGKQNRLRQQSRLRVWKLSMVLHVGPSARSPMPGMRLARRLRKPGGRRALWLLFSTARRGSGVRHRRRSREGRPRQREVFPRVPPRWSAPPGKATHRPIPRRGYRGPDRNHGLAQRGRRVLSEARVRAAEFALVGGQWNTWIPNRSLATLRSPR